jgi:hypothetical protein
VKIPYYLGIFQHSKPKIVENQSILHSVETTLDAVMESTLTVGVDHLIRAVFFSHVRKGLPPVIFFIWAK